MERGNPLFTRRNLAAFWLLGLCNNYVYVVMLSAAHDILTEDKHNVTNSENRTGKLVPECNRIGTGAVLLADILPSVIVKLTAPFFVHLISYNIRVAVVLLLGLASLLMVGFSLAVWFSLLGVVCASLGSGLGEITFLSMSAHFDRNVISTWSSGTGAAGVFGALSYAGLTAVGVRPQTAVLIMIVIMVVMAVSYYGLMVRPAAINTWCSPTSIPTESRNLLHDDTSRGTMTSDSVQKEEADAQTHRVLEEFIRKLKLLRPLLKYMVPLCLVYVAEYFINQGIVELIYYEHIWLPVDQQYRWYQVIYQVGVFISRSSVNLVQINRTWIMAVLQFGNVAILLTQVFFKYIPDIWIIFAVILYEGLLGGAAYVNTFFIVSKQASEGDREYSMAIVSVSDSFGIAVAGLISVPVHNWICTL